MQCPSASIRGVWASFEETFAFEMIHDGDHRARRNYQEVADRLLGLTRVTVDGVENCEFARLKSKSAHHFTELSRRLEADLGQGEAN
jgi:hypothetical protein